jgi:hypothetical protein
MAADSEREDLLARLYDAFDSATDRPGVMNPSDIEGMSRVGQRCEWTEARHEKVDTIFVFTVILYAPLYDVTMRTAKTVRYCPVSLPVRRTALIHSKKKSL